MFDSTAAVLQALPGNRLRVFIALVSLRSSLPVGERDVAAVAGVHRHTAVGHLRALEVLGLVSHGVRYSRETWGLTADSYQLPLPGLGLGGGVAYLEESKNNLKESKNNLKESKISTLSLSSSSIKKEEEERKENKGGRKAKNSTLGIDPELAAALREAGVGRNAWPTLANRDWVTAEYVRAHTWLRRKNNDPVRYQVQRMLAGDVMPQAKDAAVCSRCGVAISPLIGRCYCDVVKR